MYAAVGQLNDAICNNNAAKLFHPINRLKSSKNSVLLSTNDADIASLVTDRQWRH